MLMQLQMLMLCLELPLFCFVEFHLTYEEFHEAGWPQARDAFIVHLKFESTISASRSRRIDFGLFSNFVKYIQNKDTFFLSLALLGHTMGSK